jgi:hypothetical protein
MIHFFMKVHSILYISALLSACLQKISEADSASKWVEIVAEVQEIEFILGYEVTTREKYLGTDSNQENWMLVIWLLFNKENELCKIFMLAYISGLQI